MKNPKTIIITGSSRGIGRYLAEYFAKEGHNVVINYLRNKKETEKFSRLDNCLIMQGDISKINDVEKIVRKTISKFGKIDVMINNAGIHIDKPLTNMTHDEWKKVIDVNLNGTFNFCKSVIPHMKKQKQGTIINMSSFTAFRGIQGAANYSASKAGIIGLTKSLSKEIAKYGITVNAIAPGYFDIGMFNDLTNQMKVEVIKNIPARRLGTPEEILELITILMTSKYINGQIFVIDGAYST